MPLIGRRRPVLRAAVVGGAAYHAGTQRARAQEREYEQEQRLSALESQPYGDPEPEARPAVGPTPDMIEQLKQLGQLRDQGILTEEEFAAQKAKLLG